LLFVKEALSWPRSSGQDVHSYHMMRALAQLGHTVGLLTLKEATPQAVQGLTLDEQRTFDTVPLGIGELAFRARLTRLQERFRSYWGVEARHVAAVGQAAKDFKADAVIAVGLGVLPYFAAVDGPLRVWYAADEWAWHHLSQARPWRPGSWGHLRQALVKGLYERAYRRVLDRVWVVSDADARAMRWVSGVPDVAVIANGVDAEHYRPVLGPTHERSCVFWGRLDFGPNVQALQWFCRRVWPALRQQVPDARFTIYGFHPTEAVQALANMAGVKLVPDLPDLRAEVCRHAVAVFPFVSGGGIKNKLLEAAGMGLAIVGSPRAAAGTDVVGTPPFITVRRPGRWVHEIQALWGDGERRRRLGEAARQWVTARHSWPAAAERAVASLQAASGGRVS
jgi:glycosyltransferase involved in cell wall biosynthesis